MFQTDMCFAIYIACKGYTLFRRQRRVQHIGSIRDRPHSGRPKFTSIAVDRLFRLRHLRYGSVGLGLRIMVKHLLNGINNMFSWFIDLHARVHRRLFE